MASGTPGGATPPGADPAALLLASSGPVDFVTSTDLERRRRRLPHRRGRDPRDTGHRAAGDL
ncbi:MAG TPA: hypothetical protein VFC03_05330, partial [Acidimicrobiales bacterium]|nr:hypothetical protein [Acidimicrobiales bacterium]